MTSGSAATKRYRLNKKLRAGTITPDERVMLAQLNAFKKTPGRPRKSAEPPSSPEPAASASTEPPVVTATIDPIPGAAPGIEFKVTGMAEPPPEAPKAEPPKEPTEKAKTMADKIVLGLSIMATRIEQCWGFPPLMGMDAVVYPVLRHAWAVTLDELGMTARLDELANNKNAAYIAAATSAAYLGGGGIYAMYEIKKREEASKQPEAPKPEAPQAKPPKRPPVETHQEPLPFARRSNGTKAEVNEHGMYQQPMATGPAEAKA